MATPLENALSGRPWSVFGVVRGLDHVLDEEGRPLGERRAPSIAKSGVPMVLKRCPYHDERRGIPMNVSALAQVAQHQEEVLARISGLVQAVGSDRWELVLHAVVHFLSMPAITLMLGRDARAPLSTTDAVGHKLAAGFFGVVRGLIARHASGAPRQPVTAQALRDFVRDERALFGASEVCAGPPNMLLRVSRVLTGEEHIRHAQSPDEHALGISRLLAEQVRTALLWELFDRRECLDMLSTELSGCHMQPRNRYVAERVAELVRHLNPHANLTLCGNSVTEQEPIGDALLQLLPANSDPDVVAITNLFGCGDQAIDLDCDQSREYLARRCVRLLRVHGHVLRRLWELEMAARALVKLDCPSGPVEFDPSLLQRGPSMFLFDVLLGHRAEYRLGPQPQIALRNHKRELVLATNHAWLQ